MKSFLENLYINSNKTFVASSGFIWHFEKRHNICSMMEHGKKASDSTAKFVENFKVVVAADEMRADGRKKWKDLSQDQCLLKCVGAIKLLLQMIGKIRNLIVSEELQWRLCLSSTPIKRIPGWTPTSFWSGFKIPS